MWVVALCLSSKQHPEALGIHLVNKRVALTICQGLFANYASNMLYTFSLSQSGARRGQHTGNVYTYENPADAAVEIVEIKEYGELPEGPQPTHGGTEYDVWSTDDWASGGCGATGWKKMTYGSGETMAERDERERVHEVKSSNKFKTPVLDVRRLVKGILKRVLKRLVLRQMEADGTRVGWVAERVTNLNDTKRLVAFEPNLKV
ncbi:hypothetical protein BD779DRAFT_1480588 [Infundibulicybe gibba]|nr:hypothetical protein BD779DRAFT_1480588 [Infundibulicybe gibba]